MNMLFLGFFLVLGLFLCLLLDGLSRFELFRLCSKKSFFGTRCAGIPNSASSGLIELSPEDWSNTDFFVPSFLFVWGICKVWCCSCGSQNVII